MQLTVLQKLFDLPIPTTSQGWTDINGKTVIQAVQGGNPRGSGLCLELKTPAAMITDFLLATELCDLRGFNSDLPVSPNATPDDLRLSDFSSSFERRLIIDDTRLMGMVQADDAYQWSRSVADFTPWPARIHRRAGTGRGWWRHAGQRSRSRGRLSEAGSGGSAGNASAGSARSGNGVDSGVVGQEGGEPTTNEQWRSWMFGTYCPAKCDKTMSLPCESDKPTRAGCIDDCYVLWMTNYYRICPSAVPPLTLCASPDNVSWSCVNNMVEETYTQACEREAQAVSDCI